MKNDKENKKYVTLKDCIATYDNFVDPKLCDLFIEIFKKHQDEMAIDRVSGEGTLPMLKKDESIIFNKSNNWFYRNIIFGIILLSILSIKQSKK